MTPLGIHSPALKAIRDVRKELRVDMQTTDSRLEDDRTGRVFLDPTTRKQLQAERDATRATIDSLTASIVVLMESDRASFNA